MPRELTPEDILGVLKRRWALIVVAALLGGALGLGVTRFLPKRFTSLTLVLVSQPQVPSDYVKQIVTQDTQTQLVTMQTQILSRARLEPVIRQLGLYDKEINTVSMDDLVGRLAKAISVTPVQPMADTRSTGLPGFTVSVTFNDGRLAQQICSTITSFFMEENAKNRTQVAQGTKNFISGQLAEAKAKLDDQDGKLAAFQRHYIGSLPEESQTNINLLTGLTSQLDATTQGLGRLQQDKSFASSLLQQQLAEWKDAQSATVAGRVSEDTAAKQLEGMQAQLNAMKARYTDNYPDVIRLKGDIKAFKEKMALDDSTTPVVAETPTKPVRAVPEPMQIQALRTQIRQDEISIQEATARQTKIQEQIKVYQDRVQSTPAVSQEYKELTRDYQTALDLYNDLLKKKDTAEMATDLEQRQEGSQFQVLDPANLPDKPSFPNKLLFGAGGFGGGIGLSLAIILFLELQDTSVHNEKEVESLLHLPVLAAVPTFKPQANKPVADGTLPAALRS